MGSNIEAFISRDAALLESIASEIGTRCFDLPQNFLLVPVPEDAMPEDWRDAYDEFSDLDPKLAEHARSASSSGAVAYIEGSTFAGDGIQRAVVWRDEQVAWGPTHTCNLEQDAERELVWAADPREGAINAALRELGVDATGHLDEYAALGLDAKRSTEDWLG